MASDDHREHPYGRRASDELFAYRITALEELVRALGPAVGQVARIDDAVDDLEKWIRDERDARRQHNAELLESLREVRGAMVAHEVRTAEALERLRINRRTLVAALLAALATIAAAIISRL